MTAADQDRSIEDSDIIFECPFCSKSHAIDYRAAGLAIRCTDCEKLVAVPIPEGMEVSDLDESEDERAILIVNLREALKEAHERIEELEDQRTHLVNSADGKANTQAEWRGQLNRLASEVDSVSNACGKLKRHIERLNKDYRQES